MLRKLDGRQPTSNSHFEACITPSECSPPPASVVTFQGESSFNSYLAQASLTAESSARESNDGNFGQQIHTSLSSLKSLLRTQGRPSSVDDLSFPRAFMKSNEPKIDLPPLPAVLAVLKRTAGEP